jgi:hypothetical protein
LLDIDLDLVEGEDRVQAVQPENTGSNVLGPPKVGAPADFDAPDVLGNEQIFLYAGQGLVGEKLFAPVDSFSGFRKHLDDQAGIVSYYIEWHMRGALAPLLFDDEDPQAGEARRTSPVPAAQVSERAERKAATKRSADGQPVHSFHSLLADLTTITKNRIQVALRGNTAEIRTFDRITRPTPLQQKALDLLGVRL